ncbi:putative ABC transport system substrate-binding protein [Rhizobiales bacterium GAS188]|nr:putative ABC transport system substrate-binding protein [Rhizobiales bacterium GAS188]
MRRRAFIMRVGGAALAWPLVARAQRSDKRWRVGLLEYSRADVERVRLWGVFRQRLRELGYVEGDNIAFEQRWAEGRADRLPALAAELVKLQVDVIATGGTPAAQAAKGATSTIPIVMATGNPVGVGLVASLSRPGGNVTGEMTPTSEISPKLLELLREMIPHVSRIAILVDPSNSSSMLGAHETELAAQTPSGAPRNMLRKSLRVRNPPIFPSSSPPNSNWSSTSRPRSRSASKCRRCCSPRRMSSSNEAGG